MGHSHAHWPTNYGKAFAIGIGLNVTYLIVEGAYGYWTGSLALLADAGHNLSDVLGLMLAWGGYALAKLKPNERRTYGWRSSTIFAALFNALLLLVAVGGIVWEAWGRLYEPVAPEPFVVATVAGVGVIINTGTALLFVRGQEHDLNIRGAFLHMVADAAVSVGVVLGALLIYWTGWLWIDPLLSLLIAVAILVGTWGLFKESLNLALQAVPSSIDLQEVREYLSRLPGVVEVHDLHVWAMSTTEVALTAHLVKPDHSGDDELLRRAMDELRHKFGIDHTTIQLERTRGCLGCNPDV